MVFLYYLLVGFIATAVLFILWTPHAHYAALGLLLALLGMAAIYFLQGAAFIAVAYIVVYAGSVLLLLLFSTGILAPQVAPGSLKFSQSLKPLLASLSIVGVAWLWGQWLAGFLPPSLSSNPEITVPSIQQLGLQLLGPYGFAFEWTGVVLLIALVGAVCLVSS